MIIEIVERRDRNAPIHHCTIFVVEPRLDKMFRRRPVTGSGVLGAWGIDRIEFHCRVLLGLPAGLDNNEGKPSRHLP